MAGKHLNRVFIESEIKAILTRVHELDKMGYINYFHKLSENFVLKKESKPSEDGVGSEAGRLRRTLVQILLRIGYMATLSKDDLEIEICWVPSGYDLV